ncbi:TraB/GumN family protein [Sphingomonas sp. 2R-10]|uniref:TraB/GumN family protein n=1 Tax=Sphingomonas sp. 2R-10 TaxID=3045148 RepID=UPI0013DDFC73|nr:TraB/GumN family protein [Sphingomonas sp. 2R-10]MDJ0278623.1 TraB/GumN family protein [Sphingomonas sp. 2R-10]
MIARVVAALLGWWSLASPVAAPAVLAPALWVARDADTTIWLFGTVHRLRPGTPWLAGPVARAFADSDTLVLEIPPVDPDAMTAALVRVAPVRPAPLPVALDRRLRERARALGFPARAFDATDPWFAATTLAAQPLARAGYSAAPAPETLLATLAGRSGTAIEPLETLDRQLGIFAALPQPAQRTMLARVLADPDPVPAMDRIVATWGRGDVATLDRLLASDMDEAGPAVRTALLDRRNATWAGKIAKGMRRPGTRFVAVGAGHLTGPGSVQARLQVLGVEVSRVR